MSRDRVEWFLNQAFRYRSLLKRYLRKRLASEDDIEDIIQETYLRLYSLQDYEAVESPKSLLIRIAHNLAIELIRKRHRHATDTVADFGALNVSSSGEA